MNDMFYTVDCPYCGHENDMDGVLSDVNGNDFDSECSKCEREFEVHVEFEPSFSSEPIVYKFCQRCAKETRDIKIKGTIFPYPEHYKETEICPECFREGMREFYRQNSVKKVMKKMVKFYSEKDDN